MAIGITEDHAALAAATAAFLTRVAPVTDTRGRAADIARGIVPPSWKAVVDQGLAGIHLPEAAGGGGGGPVELAVVLEEAGRHLLPGPLLPTATVGAVLASPRLAAETAPVLRTLAGGTTAATTLTSAAVTAEPERDGWVLTGTASPVLGAGEAGLLLVGARDGGRSRWFVLERAAPGLEVTTLPGVDLTRSVGAVRLDRVRAGAAQLVDGLDDPAVRAAAAVTFAADALGAARWCVESALAYAKQREAFGRVIGSFQAIKHKCARAFIQLEVMAASVWDGARALGGPPDQEALAAAAAAVTVVEAAMDLALDCLTLFGGIGFTWEHDVHLYWRRCIALTQLLGATDTWAAELGAATLRAERDFRADVDADPSFRISITEILAGVAALPAEQRRTRLAAAGLVTPHYPRPYGIAATPAEQVVIAEEFGRAGIEQPSLVIGEWALPTILAHGTDQQRERFVPPTLRGEIVWCQLFSEPGAGSDLAALSTRAVRVDGGWRLQGQKVWTSSAHVADWGICLARTDPAVPKHQGISYFLVDMRSPGLQVRPLRQATGSADFNEVFFDGVFVPDDCLVGAENAGWRLARTTLANERVQMGGMLGLGTDLPAALRARPELTADPDAVRTLGLLMAERQALAALRLRSLLRRVSGLQPGAESSALKVAVSWHQSRAARAVLRWAGAEGALASGGPGDAVERYLAVPAQLIGGGTAEVQLNVIAERVLGLPRG
jgi:alkylation response protein AidB-like acyl-CoA dehydrogenase